MRKIDLAEGELQDLFGVHDENLRHLESHLDISVSARDREVFLEGDDERVDIAAKVLTELGGLIAKGYELKDKDVQTALRIAKDAPQVSLERFFGDGGIQTARDRLVRPQGTNQKLYIEAIRSHDIVFGIGPAGTGKTYLAMAMAMEALNRRNVRRVVLARPAIEAGEKLGFLPGDMYEKVNPYLRPLHDALYDLIDVGRANRLIEGGHIEIAPLAFMRGRTLTDSFVILDEAQNTTTEQMKMFLTRIGMESRAVITGDVTQIDLPAGRPSGLIEANRLLKKIRGIGFVKFDHRDVVRHPLVQDIITAYAADHEAQCLAKGASDILKGAEHAINTAASDNRSDGREGVTRQAADSFGRLESEK
ncbi:MAG TPA: PhoH family protein [Acidobacteriota bacterium]|jgi:phosphate starvation-inducible PhoH-like protein|nr:phosphate starvation-inducible protein PhoH [Acidobacteriota bacterium]MDP6687153.1 PhoH family protein [Acidobacteriota bacterium]HJO30547.1 PhoH family protein [Acidobacteriota bacterium]|tara:strand:- start:11972 stop:13060 length:1089 start_codon:yes stop_codon:yes gene_type:complete